MKTLYLECAMGASGDMLMGALVSLLDAPEEFIAEMNALGVPGVQVRMEPSGSARHGLPRAPAGAVQPAPPPAPASGAASK